MTGFGFLILFNLVSCALLPCEGQVQSPSNGTKLTFFPGSTVKIDWSYVGSISQVQLRMWFFKSSDGPQKGQLAAIAFDLPSVQKNLTIIPRFDIERPVALVLKNVDKTYNGIYTLNLLTQSSSVPQTSEVVVYIAEKPNVTFSCPIRNKINEIDDFTCTCRGEDGNPPANVTWFKDGVPVGGTEKENITLTLYNVSDKDSGIYKCEARSHSNTIFVDAKEIIVEVNFKPKDTSIEFTQNPAELGKPVTINCKSRGFPEPSYTITLNGTKNVVSTERMYTISMAGWNDTGLYNCTATNELGSNWDSEFLDVTEQGPTTAPEKAALTYASNSSTKTSTTTANTPANKEDDDGTTVVVWHVVLSLLSGIIFGILLSYIVWWSHRRCFRNRKTERHPKQDETEADTTYQELDLSKMNTEDNYQSLRVNTASNDAASNDDDSTYTELNKTRDVENNYQSLT